jgi:hypothetical protein
MSLSESYVMTDDIFLGARYPCGLMTGFLLLFDSFGLGDVRRPLWRENGSVVCICCCSFSAQSVLDPSPAGLMTIVYCLKFETPQLGGGGHAPRCVLYSSGTEWTTHTPRHWVSPSPLCLSPVLPARSVNHMGPMTRLLVLSDICGFVDVGALPDERMGL